MILSKYNCRQNYFIIIVCTVQLLFGSIANVTAQDIPAPVHFSVPGGFYTEDLELVLTHSNPEAHIYYTLDGSIPDPENLEGKTYRHMDRYRSIQQELLDKRFRTHRYQYPSTITIYDRTGDENYLSTMQTTFEQQNVPYYFPRQQIFKGTVVRAIAVVNSQMSSVETHTYFITPQGRYRFSLPVISLVVQEDQFFDYDEGIYVPGKIYDQNNPFNTSGDAQANHTQRGIEWERKASMELFEPESVNPDLRQDLGIRIHGGWSRAHPMKSLRLYARSDYGENRFRHRMFPDEPYTEFNRLLLRNSGNDWPEAMLRDPLMQGIVKHLNINTQAYRPYIIFLNGEYWGIHNMRERYDKHYLARRFGVDPDNIDLLTGNAWVDEGSNRHYRETLDYIRQHGLEESLHYEYINTRIDIKNYIDYQIAKIFVANTDWPGNNIDFWRYRTEQFEPFAAPGQDGRWRWLVLDLDLGFHLYTGCEPGNDVCTPPDHNTLAFAAREDGPSWPNPPWSTELFRELLKNEQFRNDFITRYLDQLNTAFHPERLTREVLRVAGVIEPEMGEHLERWFSGRNWHHFDRWKDLINNRLLPFAEQRPEYAREHLKEFFNLGHRYRLTVDVSDPAAGFVQVNTVNITNHTPGVEDVQWPWMGIYYEDVPVLLAAHPMPGYRFSHWEGENRRYHQPDLSLYMTKSEKIKAVFYPVDGSADVYPQSLGIFQNYPNPFNFSTVISYDLPEQSDVRLDVYDILGRHIETLIDENRPAGTHFVRWDATNHSSGVYICRLQADDQIKTITITLLK